MKKLVLLPFVMLALVLAFAAVPAVSQTPSPTPSTNDANRTRGWAHFNVTDDDAPGEVTVELVNPRPHQACFEYRSDGDEEQKTSDTNFNRAITDGLYPFKCATSNDSGAVKVPLSIKAKEYVEIRMVFGSEGNERFAWTRIDVTPIAPTVTVTAPAPTATPTDDPETSDDCKNGGWKRYGFKNQGQCNRYVNTGVDSREP